MNATRRSTKVFVHGVRAGVEKVVEINPDRAVWLALSPMLLMVLLAVASAIYSLTGLPGANQVNKAWVCGSGDTQCWNGGAK